MGNKVENYCDGCGDDIGQATLLDAAQIIALGTNGTPCVMHLCVKPEYQEPEEVDSAPVYKPPFIRGCAAKVLSQEVLGQLYKDVVALTGDEQAKAFQL